MELVFKRLRVWREGLLSGGITLFLLELELGLELELEPVLRRPWIKPGVGIKG